MPTFDLTAGSREKRRLVLDGKVLQDSSGSRYSHSELISAHVWDEAIHQVESLSILDLSTQFTQVTVWLPGIKEDPRSWAFTQVILDPDKAVHDASTSVRFRIVFDEEFWAMPYGIADLATALKSVLDANPDFGFEYWADEELLINGFGVSISVPIGTTIRELIAMSSRLPNLVRLIRHELSSRQHPHSVVASFEFSDPIRSAYEQYLLYFSQFLRDLGIEADSELKEEASQVLFAVTPRDQKQALVVIWNALAIYLQIPFAPEFNTLASSFSNVATSQLQANVSHLQSQIALARAVLEAKEATIAARDAQISALQQRLDIRQFAPVENSDAKKTPDSEPLIEGVLAVKKYDFKGLEIDLPAILRRLKRIW